MLNIFIEVVNEYGYEQLFSIIFITLINFSLEMKCVCVCEIDVHSFTISLTKPL